MEIISHVKLEDKALALVEAKKDSLYFIMFNPVKKDVIDGIEIFSGDIVDTCHNRNRAIKKYANKILEEVKEDDIHR